MTVVDAPTTDRYPTRVADRPQLIERAEPTVWGRTPGPLTPGELDAHERDGFVTVPRLLTPNEVDRYSAELDRLASDPDVRADERTIVEKTSQQVRSIFEVHRLSDAIARTGDRRARGGPGPADPRL